MVPVIDPSAFVHRSAVVIGDVIIGPGVYVAPYASLRGDLGGIRIGAGSNTPGALAGLLMGMHAPEARVIASVTFIAILMTILIQATTTRWLARRLDLLEE